MKPFSLQEALAGKPVVKGCVDKHLIAYITHLPGAPEERRVYAQYASGGYDWHYEDGRPAIYPEKESCRLFMAAVKREGWVNVFKQGCTGGWHATKEIADKFGIGRIACCRIEWEE